MSTGRATRYLNGTWFPGSVLTNPVDQTVLADSGPMATAGDYLVGLSAAGSVAWVYDIQHRDAANATTLQVQRRRPAAGNEDMLFPNAITLVTNERIRLVLQGAITGEVQCSLFLVNIA